MGFSRQEYWSGLPFPSPRDLCNLGIEPGSFALQANSLLAEPPGKPILYVYIYIFSFFSCYLTTEPNPKWYACCAVFTLGHLAKAVLFTLYRENKDKWGWEAQALGPSLLVLYIVVGFWPNLWSCL